MALVMLIEEEVPLLRLYEGALSLDHEVFASESTETARQKLASERPDLIVLGLNRQLSGVTLLEYMRSQGTFGSVPVMIMVTEPGQMPVMDGLALTMLSRPVTVSTLRRTMALILSQVPASRSRE